MAPYITFIAPEFITDSLKDSERIDELLQERDHDELKNHCYQAFRKQLSPQMNKNLLLDH